MCKQTDIEIPLFVSNLGEMNRIKRRALRSCKELGEDKGEAYKASLNSINLYRPNNDYMERGQ